MAKPTLDASDWFQRIEHAKERRNEWTPGWDEVDRAVRGKSKVHRVSVNLAHSSLQSFLPKVLLTRPRIIGRPKRETATESAKLTTALDNYMIDELRLVPEWRRCAADAASYGIGILKVGYIPPDDEYPERTDKPDTESDRAIEQIEEQLAGETEAPEIEQDPAILIDPLKKRNQFFAERVSPRQFLFDAMAQSWRSMRWMCHEIIMPVNAIRNEPRFRSRVRGKVNATVTAASARAEKTGTISAVDMSVDRPGRSGRDDADGFDTLYEIWDWENQRLVVAATSVEELLMDIEWPYPTEGFPFILLEYNTAPDLLVPISDIQAAIPQIAELNFLRSARADHLRRFNRKYAVDPQYATDDNVMQEITIGEDGAIAKIPPSAIASISDAPTSPDYDRHEFSVRQDFREITAQSEIERGGALRSGTSATEAAAMQANTLIRSTYHRAITEEFITDTFRVLNALMREYLDSKIVVKITGDQESGPRWRAIGREDIQGEYDVEVIPGSTVPMTQELERQRVLQLVGVLSPFVQAGVIPLAPILEKVLDAFDIKDVEGFLGVPKEQIQSPAQIAAPLAGGGASPIGRNRQPATPLAQAFGSQGFGGGA